jgi:hypothetical protein
MTPPWTRPDDLRPRSRRWTPLVGGVIVISLAVSIGMWLAAEPAQMTIVTVPMVTGVPVVAGVTRTTPPAPVHVNVTVPPPSPPPVVEPPPNPPVRALTPRLDPECIGWLPTSESTPSSPACGWDFGFPAISADGSLIVQLSAPDDGGRGWPGLSVKFIDVVTSKIVRSILILDPNEHDNEHPNNDALRAKIKRRSIDAQRVIDASRFRSLVWLDPALGDGGVYGEIDGNAMRLVDPATHTVIWQHRFEAPAPKPRGRPDDDCQSWKFSGFTAWWDPATRTVFATLGYQHGGCLCGSSSIAQVFRVAP